jgi:hypothetical protein
VKDICREACGTNAEARAQAMPSTASESTKAAAAMAREVSAEGRRSDAKNYARIR